MESLRTVKAVKPIFGTTLQVRWKGAGAVDLDLRDLMKQPSLLLACAGWEHTEAAA